MAGHSLDAGMGPRIWPWHLHALWGRNGAGLEAQKEDLTQSACCPVSPVPRPAGDCHRNKDDPRVQPRWGPRAPQRPGAGETQVGLVPLL